MSETAQPFYLPADLVARAIQQLADECHAQVDALAAQPDQGDPDVKTEARHWLAQYRAFTKAAYYWGAGVRPVATVDGWLVPSASRAGAVVHAVTRRGGVWSCGPTCEAKSFHWHTALVVALERAHDMADAEDDGLDLGPQYTAADAPICFDDGTPIPAEPDPAAEEGFCLPGLELTPRAVRRVRVAA